MKRRVGLAALVMLVVMLFGMPVWAETITSGDWEYEFRKAYEIDGVYQHLYLTKYTGNQKTITIPNKIDGNDVYGWDGEIIAYKQDVEKINVQANVIDTFFFNNGFTNLKELNFTGKIIGTLSIGCCENLKSVTIKNVENGSVSFYECPKLTDIRINSVTDGDLFELGYGCPIEEVDVPEGMERVNFYQCEMLRKVSVPMSVKTATFSECSNLNSILLSEGVSTISIVKCEKLVSINIPASVTQIGNAFEYCYQLKDIYYAGSECQWKNISIISDPPQASKISQANIHFAQETVHEFGDWIINKDATCKEAGNKERTCSICGEKQTEIIPKLAEHSYYDFWEIVKEPTCKEVGTEERTCWICSEKETREVPKLTYHSYGDWVILQEPTDSADGIKERTCTICGEKETKAIPCIPVITGTFESEKETKTEAERETEADTEILTETETEAKREQELSAAIKTGSVHSDKKSASRYKVLKDKKTVEYKAPLKKSITKVTIPATIKISGKTYKVKSIAANAFKGCKKLTTVTIGKNITTIGKKAFYNCKKLKKIVIKTSTLKKVGANAFKGINAKATIKVPKKKLATYTKLLKKKGIGKKVKIIK